MQIKHRKAEIAHERGGLMASIGQTIVGPRFYETDEVRFPYTAHSWIVLKTPITVGSGSIDKKSILTASRLNSEV